MPAAQFLALFCKSRDNVFQIVSYITLLLALIHRGTKIVSNNMTHISPIILKTCLWQYEKKQTDDFHGSVIFANVQFVKPLTKPD